jgi:hypothetical protein
VKPTSTGTEVLIAGVRDERGKIFNGIGEVIWMRREDVCSDNSNACAGGLHIGSEQYAMDWAHEQCDNGHLMVVEFSPEHVVSVPTCEHAKLRVYKYRVVGELNGDKLGEVFNNNYVRPTNEPADAVVVDTTFVPDADEWWDDGDESDAEAEVLMLEQGNAEGIAISPTTYPKKYKVSDWSKGQAAGLQDGKGHQKRKFYEEDRGRSFKQYSVEFVTGYLTGYRDGRNGK